MTGAGRPLRFLALVLGAWIGLRAAMLWPGDPVVAAERALVPRSVAPVAMYARPIMPPPQRDGRSFDAIPFSAIVDPPPAASRDGGTPGALPNAVATLPAGQAPTPAPGIIAGLPVASPPPLPPSSRAGRPRLFGSAWLFVRDGRGAAGGVPAAQLGGSQAGLRLAYALTEDRRLAFAARASSPLGAGLRELALGVEWQPTRLPVRLVAEQRIALGDGRGGPTLAAVGGVGPLPLAAGFRLEAYAQGGVIARDGGEGYADGALRVARPLARLGGVKVDLGGGSWGAAQKGANRVDIGPSLSATLPIGAQPVRLSLDWRQRVAGNAAPGSGPVLTLGADF